MSEARAGAPSDGSPFVPDLPWPRRASFFFLSRLLVSPCPSQLWLRSWGEEGSWGGDNLGVVHSQDIAPTGATRNPWVTEARDTGSHGPGLGRGCLWFPQALGCRSLPEWGTPRAQGERVLWVRQSRAPLRPYVLGNPGEERTLQWSGQQTSPPLRGPLCPPLPVPLLLLHAGQLWGRETCKTGIWWHGDLVAKFPFR